MPKFKAIFAVMTLVRRILLSAFSLCVCLPLAVQAQDPDSLVSVVAQIPDNGERLFALEQICKNHASVDTVLKYGQMELDLASRLDSVVYKAKANDNLSWAFHCKLDFEQASKHRLEAIEIWDSLQIDDRLAFSYMNYATIMLSTKNYNIADEYYKTSLEIFSRLADTAHIGRVLQYLGLLNLGTLIFDNAESYYRQAIEFDSVAGNMRGLAYDYSGLGEIALVRLNSCEGDSAKSILAYSKQMLSKAYRIATQIDDIDCILSVIPKVCDVYIAESQIYPQRNGILLDSCRMLYSQGRQIEDEYGYDFVHIYLQISYINYLLQKRDYQLAFKTIRQTEAEIIEYGDADANMPMLYQAYIDYYKAVGNNAKALEYSELKYSELLDETARTNQVKMVQTRFQTEYSLKMQERIQAERERESEFKMRAEMQHRIMIYIVLAFILALLLAIVFLVSTIKRKRMNRQLESIQTRLLAQNKLINKANKNITSSIRYAKHIQEVAMPSNEMMQSLFGDCLIIFRPRDIVSGDFYWATQVGRYKAFAVADCTGHGVPGAFLSMLGISMLNDLVASVNMNSTEISASMLLNEMRTNIRKSLRQKSDDYTNQDGMDIAFCLYDTKQQVLQYAGAFRPLLLIRDGQVIQYEADRMPIGAYMQLNKPFTNNIIDIESGDVIYLYTDGITDQFNTDDDPVKFTAPRLRNLLLDNHKRPFAEQYRIYEQKIDSWRTSPKTHQVIHQTDDMLLLGIRF